LALDGSLASCLSLCWTLCHKKRNLPTIYFFMDLPGLRSYVYIKFKYDARYQLDEQKLDERSNIRSLRRSFRRVNKFQSKLQKSCLSL